MIYDKIYKIKLEKDKRKLFDLGWEKLIKLQIKYIWVIEKILKQQYRKTIKELKTNSEVNFNDIFIDQKQFIKKDFQENINKFVLMISRAFKIWIKELNNTMKAEVKVDSSFWLDAEYSVNYAKKYSADLVTNIDEYTKKSINKVIVDWIEKWYWTNKIKATLLENYAFSNYRASLIASNEIWKAYIEWQDQQFDYYRQEYGQTGRKNWISHRDDRTSAGCLENDNQGWIEQDREFQSWNMLPPRFPWCRCRLTYRLFKPKDIE